MRYMELSIRIAKWRKARGLSQSALAEAAGITVSAISHIERGRANPSQPVLNAIVDRLGLSMEKFYGRTPRTRAAA